MLEDPSEQYIGGGDTGTISQPVVCVSRLAVGPVDQGVPASFAIQQNSTNLRWSIVLGLSVENFHKRDTRGLLMIDGIEGRVSSPTVTSQVMRRRKKQLKYSWRSDPESRSV
jgi:hypothetical protein